MAMAETCLGLHHRGGHVASRASEAPQCNRVTGPLAQRAMFLIDRWSANKPIKSTRLAGRLFSGVSTMRYPQFSLLIIALTMPATALATDYSGVTVFFGIPVMGGALLIYGLLAVFPRMPKAIYTLATMLFVPLMIVASLAAADGLANIGTKFAHVSYIYYVLIVLVSGCFWTMFKRRRAVLAGANSSSN